MASIVAWLSQNSTTSLLYLCDRHKVPGKALSRQHMLDALLVRFSDPEYVHRTVKELPRPLRLTLLAYAISEHSWDVPGRLDKLLGEPHKPYLKGRVIWN